MTHIAQYQKDPSVTPFGNLRLHIQRHAYKKGCHAGAAPADTSRRGKSHFRVEQRAAAIAVVFHWTDILIAYEDGSIELDSGGYETSPTTRAALEDALWLAGYKGWLRSDTRNDLLNTVLQLAPTNGAWIRVGWADGITIARDGTVTGYAPIKTYRADKEARKAWREKAQPFKEMLPILLAGLEAQGTGRGYLPYGNSIQGAALYPEHWPDLAQYLAFHSGYDPRQAWAYLDRAATEDMRVIVEEE